MEQIEQAIGMTVEGDVYVGSHGNLYLKTSQNAEPYNVAKLLLDFCVDLDAEHIRITVEKLGER